MLPFSGGYLICFFLGRGKHARSPTENSDSATGPAWARLQKPLGVAATAGSTPSCGEALQRDSCICLYVCVCVMLYVCVMWWVLCLTRPAEALARRPAGAGGAHPHICICIVLYDIVCTSLSPQGPHPSLSAGSMRDLNGGETVTDGSGGEGLKGG